MRTRRTCRHSQPRASAARRARPRTSEYVCMASRMIGSCLGIFEAAGRALGPSVCSGTDASGACPPGHRLARTRLVPAARVAIWHGTCSGLVKWAGQARHRDPKTLEWPVPRGNRQCHRHAVHQARGWPRPLLHAFHSHVATSHTRLQASNDAAGHHPYLRIVPCACAVRLWRRAAA